MKILRNIALLAFACTVSTSVFAENFFVNYSAQNPDIVEISGESNHAENTKITVSVFQKDMNFESLDGTFDEKTNRLHFISTAFAGADGTWKIEWTPSEGGEFDFYAADGTEAPRLISRKIVSGMKNVYETLRNGDDSALEALFENREYLETLVADKEILSGIKQPGLCGKYLYRLRKEFPAADASDLIPLAAALNALDESGEVYAAESAVQAYGILGVTIKNLEVYNENATEKIKVNLAARLSGCGSMDSAAFSENFSEQLILAGIAECVNWKDAELYLDLLQNSDYEKNREAVAKAVAGKNYTMTELISKIKSMTFSSSSGGGSSGGSKGGSGTAQPISVTAPKNASDTNTEESRNVIFNDVDETHWAFSYINFLRWKNIVCGDEKGYFYPEDTITRAESVKILCESFGIEPDMMYSGDFSDVTDKDWFFGYVNAGMKNGLVNGTGEGYFSPEANVSREDLAVLIYRFAKNAKYTFETKSEAEFTDEAEAADYAKEAIKVLCEAEIIFGTDGKLMPKSDTSRAQTAAMVCRVLETKKAVTE